MSFCEPQRPDYIAHQLATHVGAFVRIHLSGDLATVPLEPYRDSYSVPTETVPLASFIGYIENAEIVDGGVNLFGMNGIHLPETEWRRVGLQKHWEADDADLKCPFFPPQRKLELWASREEFLSQESPSEPYAFDHLDEIPDDSPLITKWQNNSSAEWPDKPPVPFSRPTVALDAILTTDVTDARGLNRVEFGTIDAVEILEPDAEPPAEPEIESRSIPTLMWKSPQPETDYSTIDPLAPTDQLIRAVFTVNRYAKKFEEQASNAYRQDLGAKASLYSIQKQALYTVKTVALHRFVKASPECIELEHHVLDDTDDTICFYFKDGFSFHQPTELVANELISDVLDGRSIAEMPTRNIRFEKRTDIDTLAMSLADALQVLAENGINANDFLAADSVTDFDSGNEFSTTFSSLVDHE